MAATQNLHPALSNPLSVQVKYRPVLQESIPPLPNPERLDYLQCKDWWTEQLRRCRHGWVCPDDMVFINPIYYFYLNFVKVQVVDELNKGKSGWMSPYFRDGDKEYFDAVYYGQSYEKRGKLFNAKNLVVAKGRRKGWTTCELFGITQWYFLFRQGFNISRAYPNDKVKNKERRLFVTSYSHTHEFFKRNESDEMIDIMIDNEDELSQWTYFIDEKTGKKQKKTQVNSTYLYSVGSDGGGVRGDKLSLIIVVEAGIHTKLGTFYPAAEETLKLGDYKFGQMLVGGTSDAINNETIDYKSMYYSPSSYNATTVFTPSWKCYFGCFDYFTGKSMREKALEKIISKRQQIEADGDYELLRSTVQENPITAEESFIPSGKSEYDSIKIDRQYMSILRNRMDDEWVKGRLEWEKDTYGKRTGKVSFVRDASGKWLILERFGVPILNVEGLYVAGIDDVYKDKAPHSTSQNCMVVYMKNSIHVSGVSGLPVAFYLGRHPNRILDYEEFHKGTIYYNPMVMYEHNDSGGYIGYAKEAEIKDRFIYHNGQIGIRLSDETKADMTLLGLRWFAADEHEKVLHSKLIESFKYWDSSINSDIASAFHLVLLAIEKTKKRGTKELEETQSTQAPAFTFGMINPFQSQTSSEFFRFGIY